MGAKEVFANRLRELRIAKKLSQTELAEKLGVSRGSISFYENGERTADIDFIYKIAQFFNVSTDFLLGYDYPGAQTEAVNCIIDFLSDAQRMCKSVPCADCKLSSFCYTNYDISKKNFIGLSKKSASGRLSTREKPMRKTFLRSFRKQSRIKKVCRGCAASTATAGVASTPL